MSGVVAAGHPVTAEAGAEVLREGGNAVDAAVCAVLASFAAESPLTGFGAGGFMMVHRGEETVLLDFFVAAPGADRVERGAELVPVPVHFDAETVQTFYVGPASCGVPGTAAGLEQALARFGTVPLAELVKPGVRLAREGAPVNAEQAYILDILEPIHARLEGTRELYAPAGRTLREGDLFRFEELAEALERFAAEGSEAFYRGEVAAELSDFVVEHGGTLGPGDLAGYEAIERRPIRAAFRGAEVLTNPPPSSGGILIAYCLGLLERLGERSGPEQLVAAMGAANEARGEAFAEALYGEGLEASLLEPDGLDLAAGDLLGSTTHISVLDGDGMCASVTCSNGSGSGVLVPGTGVILNNMLGEEDLNPLGFHAIAPGRRVPSMMAPTVVLRDGEIEPRARQRRLQPDPLGDPADDRALGRAGDGGRGGGAGAAPALRGRRRPGRARDRRGGAGTDRGPRSAGPAAARGQPLLRRGAGGRPRSRYGCVERWRRPAPRR